MPHLLIELFSEEIPARMQGGAARDLERMAAERLKALRSRARFVNLAQYPDFDQVFFENLYLQPMREV